MPRPNKPKRVKKLPLCDRFYPEKGKEAYRVQLDQSCDMVGRICRIQMAYIRGYPGGKYTAGYGGSDCTVLDRGSFVRKKTKDVKARIYGDAT